TTTSVLSLLSLPDALPICVAYAQGAAYPVGEFFKPTMSSGAALSPSGNRIAVAENLGTDENWRSAIDFLDAADPEGQRRRVDLRSEEHTSELQSREKLVCR